MFFAMNFHLELKVHFYEKSNNKLPKITMSARQRIAIPQIAATNNFCCTRFKTRF